MPCLNEAETLADCIVEARAALRRAGLAGEVIIADNGSTDGSREIARRLRARVVDVPRKGYGYALQGGIAAARGRYIVMGDADRSYDFASLPVFIDKLRAGGDLVMGNRFQGGIERGAMPWLNRWVGNPVLTRVGRFLFGSSPGDFHCGLRAFRRDAYEAMNLRSGGMEFASEMVVKASLRRLAIVEVPTVLRRDGRSRPPHLRPWRDGWRHLRFMLLFSPRWLFLVPGATLMTVSTLVAAWLIPSGRRVGPVGLDIDTLLVAGVLCLVGYQLIVFAVFTKVFAVREGFHPPHPTLNRLFRYVNLELGLLTGFGMVLAGLVPLAIATWRWAGAGFDTLDPRASMRVVIPAVVLLALGVQTVFASFFLSILGIDRDSETVLAARRR